jgi:Protein of unknown function (DUF2752)
MTSPVGKVAATRGSGSGWRRLLPHAAVLGAVAAATAYVWAVDPHEPGHYPVCPTYALSGIYCPGCGMLRATHALLHLDLAGSVSRNPLAIPLFVGVVALYVVWVRASWRGRSLGWDPPRWLPVALAVAFVAFTAARNVPGFTWLSPA